MLDGLLNIDKPPGITSHDAVDKVRWLSQQRRVGHTGTLDPLASGVLIICLGRATRLAEYVVGLPKTYLATIRLGQVTTTYDTEGQIVEDRPVGVSQEQLVAALGSFEGKISQVPPMYSAVKKAGRPLYERARQGEIVERPARTVTIYRLELISWALPLLTVRVVCSTGTYIRSLAHDLGQSLGTGGHLSELRRTAVGHFDVEDAVPLAQLSRDNWLPHLQPPDTAVQHLPKITVSLEEARQLLQGQRVERRPDQAEAPLVRAYDPQGCFVGLLTIETEQWQARKIMWQPAD